MRITHFPTPWDEQSSSQRVRFYTVLSSGTASSYFYGLLDNCILIKHKLPEFTCFVYHNHSLPKNIKDVLEKLGNVRLIHMNNTNDKRNTMWCFLQRFFCSNKRDSRCKNILSLGFRLISTTLILVW